MHEDDAELLRRYVSGKSENAFAELVRRHLDLVYAVALRQVGGDVHLAQDVAQVVFTALARKAAALTARPVLGGWLYRTTQFAAIDAVRAESRRRAREAEANSMHESTPNPGTEVDWEKLRPTLDQVIGELGDNDRDAIVLRFFEGKSFAEVGRKLLLTENAARMRVERARDKLHALLVRRGITSTTAALALALANPAGVAAPTGLAATVTGAALAGAAAGEGTLAALTGILAMDKFQTGMIVVIAVASVATLTVETRATRTLEVEVKAVRANYVSLQPLQDENARLKTAAAALSPSPEDAAELARLRQRSAELGARVSAMRDPSERIVGRTRGEASAHERSSPFLAWQGMVRTMFADDYERLGWLLCFDAAGRTKLDAFFARLSPEARAQAGSPEALVARVFVQWRWQGDPPRRYGGGVKEIPVGNDAIVEIPQTYWSGRKVTERFAFKRTDDGWRYGPITSTEVDQILVLLNPATGEPAAQPATAFYSRPR